MGLTFFSAVSLWILSHTACVSELPGSRILFDVILPKVLSTDWRGISFNKALHTSKKQTNKKTQPHPYQIHAKWGKVLQLHIFGWATHPYLLFPCLKSLQGNAVESVARTLLSCTD